MSRLAKSESFGVVVSIGPPRGSLTDAVIRPKVPLRLAWWLFLLIAARRGLFSLQLFGARKPAPAAVALEWSRQISALHLQPAFT